MLTSIHVYNKYNYRRTFIAYLSNNHFTLNQKYHHMFSIYQHRTYTAAEFLNKMRQGTVTFYDTQFLVIFKDTARGKLLQNPDLQVFVSYRAPHEDIELFPIALVSSRDLPEVEIQTSE